MPKQFDLIVFDWDGTLANSTKMIADCMRLAAHDAKLPVPDEVTAAQVIGLGLSEAVHALFGELHQDQYDILTNRYRYYYYARDEETILFDGVFDAVKELKRLGFDLAVATGKGRNGLNKSLERSGLKPYIDASRTVDECFSKPHPQMLDDLMDQMVTLPERTLMVGDTSFDMQMAQNANVKSLAVTYGAHALEKLLPFSPLAHFDNFAKVNDWILTNA